LQELTQKLLTSAWADTNTLADSLYIKEQLQQLDKKIQQTLENSSTMESLIRFIRSLVGLSNGNYDLYEATNEILKAGDISPELAQKISEG
jgi:hypothetical protein